MTIFVTALLGTFHVALGIASWTIFVALFNATRTVANTSAGSSASFTLATCMALHTRICAIWAHILITIHVTVLKLILAELIALVNANASVRRHVVALDLADFTARHIIRHLEDRLASASSVR